MRNQTVAVLFIMVGVGFYLLIGCDASSSPKPEPTPKTEKTPVPTAVEGGQVSSESKIDELRAKLKAINEYYYKVDCVTKFAQGELAYTEERWFRRPNRLHAKMIQTNHTIKDIIGTVTYTICTGDRLWTYSQDVAGRVTIYFLDLPRMNAAGIAADEQFVRAGHLIKPFRLSRCDENSLQVVAEDENTITILAAPNQVISNTFREVRLTFNKADGVLREIAYLSPDGLSDSLVKFSDVRLNPDPPFEDSHFTYTPPLGVQVMDNTDLTIESIRRQRSGQ